MTPTAPDAHRIIIQPTTDVAAELAQGKMTREIRRRQQAAGLALGA